MRDRYAVRSTQTAEIPALHAARITLADRSAGHIDILTGHEVIGRNLRADRDQCVLADAKPRAAGLRLDLGEREVATRRLGDVRHLADAGAELQRYVSVLVLGAVGDDL